MQRLVGAKQARWQIRMKKSSYLSGCRHDSHFATTHVPLTASTAPPMAPTHSSDNNTWAVQHVLALVEIWALVAQQSGFVGAWRLTAVCRAPLAGVKEWLGTFPGLVLSGGLARDEPVSKVWGLDIVTCQWVPMSALVAARRHHASCVGRGALVVLGGYVESIKDKEERTSRVEILLPVDQDRVFIDLPALSCGRIAVANALAVEVSNSVAGQVLLLGGRDE